MIKILVGHVLDRLADLSDESVHCCVTSPPYYGLRDYGIEPQVWADGWRGSLGLEPTPALYVEHMVAVFREVKRVLRNDGTLWVNIGDSYAGVKAAGCKPKDLLGMPWMLAFALRDDGWWLRSEITWAKRAPMPESVTDRPGCATEKVFLLAKSARYFYDAEAVKEEQSEGTIERFGNNGSPRQPGPKSHSAIASEVRSNSSFASPVGVLANGKRNMRNWWLLGPEPFSEGHFATFPTEIPRRAILVGCPPGGTVLDPFFGAGTTGLVADQLQRDCTGIELNPDYATMAVSRVRQDNSLFTQIVMAADVSCREVACRDVACRAVR